MKKKKSKISITQFFSNAWLDLRFKLIIFASFFIAFLLVMFLIARDVQNDKKILESKANKYETYVDQLLLAKYSIDELKNMNEDQLKLAVDVVIDEANNIMVESPKLNDFILPVKDDDYSSFFELTREAKSKWSQSDIDQFWIDLETLDIKNLDENNFDYLKARLKDIR